MSNFPLRLEQYFSISSYDQFLVRHPVAVEILDDLHDGPVVPQEVVLHVLGPAREVAGHLHNGVLRRREFFLLASFDGRDDSPEPPQTSC